PREWVEGLVLAADRDVTGVDRAGKGDGGLAAVRKCHHRVLTTRVVGGAVRSIQKQVRAEPGQLHRLAGIHREPAVAPDAPALVAAAELLALAEALAAAAPEPALLAEPLAGALAEALSTTPSDSSKLRVGRSEAPGRQQQRRGGPVLACMSQHRFR